MVYGDEDVPRCPACRQREGVAALWGCGDAPAVAPVYARACVVCLGQGDGCEACDGAGTVPVRRCPAAEFRLASPMDARSVIRFRDAYLDWTYRYTPPVAGGREDQAASFLDACRLMDACRGYHEGERREAMERKMRRMENAGGRRG